MRPYTVFINEGALSTAPRSGKQRQETMDFIRSLASNPDCPGDFSEKDESGRIAQVKIVGRFAITFWPDHAVREIKVTHIKPADI
jgi:hypothetical protein